MASTVLTASASAAQPRASSDGTLPWSMNTSQNALGPTSAWTEMNSHILNICNGKWCWQFNQSTTALDGTNPNGWLNDGNPVDISATLGSRLRASNGVLPWTNNGPTAGWEEYKNKYLSINVRSLMWLRSEQGAGSWANSGNPYNLPEENFWKDIVAASDGTLIWSNRGITSAWTDKRNSREYFCNGKWCWVFNYDEGRWHNQENVTNRGRAFDMTGLLNVAPAPNGTTLFTNGGPTVGWTDDVRNKSTVCNNGWCWSYIHQAGARPDMLDVRWERINNQGQGQAFNPCVTWGGTNCPGTPPPAPRPGDFNGDNEVNIYDVNALISKLNTTTPGYNLVGDAVVDIFDFNELLKLLR